MKKFLLLLPCIIYAQIDLRNYILKLDEQILKGNISNVSILKKSDKNITNITKSKIPLKKEQKTSKSNKPCKNSDEFIELKKAENEIINTFSTTKQLSKANKKTENVEKTSSNNHLELSELNNAEQLISNYKKVIQPKKQIPLKSEDKKNIQKTKKIYKLDKNTLVKSKFNQDKQVARKLNSNKNLIEPSEKYQPKHYEGQKIKTFRLLCNLRMTKKDNFSKNSIVKSKSTKKNNHTKSKLNTKKTFPFVYNPDYLVTLQMVLIANEKVAVID